MAIRAAEVIPRTSATVVTAGSFLNNNVNAPRRRRWPTSGASPADVPWIRCPVGEPVGRGVLHGRCGRQRRHGRHVPVGVGDGVMHSSRDHGQGGEQQSQQEKDRGAGDAGPPVPYRRLPAQKLVLRPLTGRQGGERAPGPPESGDPAGVVGAIDVPSTGPWSGHGCGRSCLRRACPAQRGPPPQGGHRLGQPQQDQPQAEKPDQGTG